MSYRGLDNLENAAKKAAKKADRKTIADIQSIAPEAVKWIHGEAVASGDRDFICWVLDTVGPPPYEFGLFHAAVLEQGDLDLLKWLVEKVPLSDPAGLLLFTLEEEQLGIAKWIVEQHPESIVNLKDSWIYCVKKSIPFAKWAHSHGMFCHDHDHGSPDILAYNTIEDLEWLTENYPDCINWEHPNLLEEVICVNRLDVLKWIKANYPHALAEEHDGGMIVLSTDEVVDWAKDNAPHWLLHEDSVATAVTHGALHILEWIQERRPNIMKNLDKHLKEAQKCGQVAIHQYLEELRGGAQN